MEQINTFLELTKDQCVAEKIVIIDVFERIKIWVTLYKFTLCCLHNV